MSHVTSKESSPIPTPREITVTTASSDTNSQTIMSSTDNSTRADGSINSYDRSMKRTTSGLQNSQMVKMRRLVRKLFILLVSNVTISLLCLIILYRELSFSAACVDMMVSNLCLWLSYSFNEKQYQKLCHLCIKCSHICPTK